MENSLLPYAMLL